VRIPTLSLYFRIALGPASPPLSPAQVTPGRSRSTSVASSMNGYDLSQFVLVQTEEEWAQAMSTALIGPGEKISLRLVESESEPNVM